MAPARITGSVRVETQARGRVYVAAFITAGGSKTRRVLGPAHVKDSGKRTNRNAVVWRAADGPRPTDDHLTPTEAQDRLTALLHEQKELRLRVGSRPVKAAGRTVGDAAAEYLRHKEFDKAIAASTLRDYRSIVKAHVLPKLGAETRLQRVTADVIEEWQSALIASGRERSTVRGVMIVVRGIFKRATRLGWIASNPMSDVEVVAQPKAEVEFNVLTGEQIEQVARAIENGWEPHMSGERRRTRVPDELATSVTEGRRRQAGLHAAIVRVAAYTGLRLGELRALRWRDIDWAGEVVRVSRNAPVSAPSDQAEKAPKSMLGRSVPLIPAAIVALDGLSKRKHHAGPDDLVFPAPLGGHIDDGAVRDAFYKGLYDAGLGAMREKPTNPMTFHDLRHVFGTLAVQNFTVPEVQGMMGHSNIATTMRYIHYVPRHDAAARLALAFAPADAGAGPTEARL